MHMRQSCYTAPLRPKPGAVVKRGPPGAWADKPSRQRRKHKQIVCYQELRLQIHRHKLRMTPGLLKFSIIGTKCTNWGEVGGSPPPCCAAQPSKKNKTNRLTLCWCTETRAESHQGCTLSRCRTDPWAKPGHNLLQKTACSKKRGRKNPQACTRQRQAAAKCHC